MTRVKRGSISRRYRKSILNFASGFRGAHSKLFRAASQQEHRALACAYVDRSNRKRRFRRLWIVRINAAARKNGTTYSLLIHKLLENQVFLNRRVLAQVATLDAYCFSKLILKISSNEHQHPAVSLSGLSGEAKNNKKKTY